jgi:hypothetical protein
MELPMDNSAAEEGSISSIERALSVTVLLALSVVVMLSMICGTVTAADPVGIVTDFENGTVTDNWYGDTDNASFDSTTAQSGSQSVKLIESSGVIRSDPANESLPRYPQRGDSWVYYTRLEAGHSYPPNSKFRWASSMPGEYANYQIEADKQASTLKIAKRNATGFHFIDKTSVSIPASEWLRVEVTHALDGTITVTLYDSTGSKLATASGVDTDHTDGKIGLNEGGDGAIWTDNISITNTNTTHGTVTDTDGNAIDDATVEAVNTSTGKTEHTTTTDSTGSYRLSLPPGEYEVTASADGYENTTKTVDVPEGGTMLDFCLGDCSSSSKGYTQTFELDDQSGKYPDPEFEVKEPDLSEYQGSKVLTKGDNWQTVDSTTFNHEDEAFVELENDSLYLLSLRDGGALYEQSGFEAHHSNDVYVIQPGKNESVNGTNVTATPTPINTSRENVSVTPYDGGIRLTYDGEEPLDDFEYSLEGPDDKTYNVSRDFEEPTSYFQSDLEDPVIGNASENSEDYTVDWNSSTTDGEELGGQIDVGENQGYEFGSGGSDGGGGGGGGLVPADSGGDSPIWVTAVPALAAIGYAVYRSRSTGV